MSPSYAQLQCELRKINAARLPWLQHTTAYEASRSGTFLSSFEDGLERTVAWICGLQHIREVIAFPRMMQRLKP